MSTTGLDLQRVHHASGQKPAGKEPAAPATTHEAIKASRDDALHPLDPSAPSMVQTFAAPPPLLHRRAAVRRSYTSLIAMAPNESLLPPSSQTDSRHRLCHAAPPPVRDVHDRQTPASAPTPANAQNLENVQSPANVQAHSSAETPAHAHVDAHAHVNANLHANATANSASIVRVTAYPERCISARDVICAIDDLWGLDQLPSVELFSKE